MNNRDFLQELPKDIVLGYLGKHLDLKTIKNFSCASKYASTLFKPYVDLISDQLIKLAEKVVDREYPDLQKELSTNVNIKLLFLPILKKENNAFTITLLEEAVYSFDVSLLKVFWEAIQYQPEYIERFINILNKPHIQFDANNLFTAYNDVITIHAELKEGKKSAEDFKIAWSNLGKEQCLLPTNIFLAFRLQGDYWWNLESEFNIQRLLKTSNYSFGYVNEEGHTEADQINLEEAAIVRSEHCELARIMTGDVYLAFDFETDMLKQDMEILQHLITVRKNEFENYKQTINLMYLSEKENALKKISIK